MSAIKSLHRRFPWVPPLVVLMVGIASVALLETREDAPIPEAAVDNDVVAALKLLLQTQDITAEVFTCPATQPTEWNFGGGANTALNWSDWRGTSGEQRNLSYSYQNPFEKSLRPSIGEVQSGK